MRNKRGYISKERIKKFAEVFTPDWVVDDMVNNVESCSPDTLRNGTVLEPACGEGPFLQNILIRKLIYGVPPTEALKTLYGVELLADNVALCRQKLLEIAGDTPENREIVNKNIIQGNFLKDLDTIVFYDWKNNTTSTLRQCMEENKNA